MNVGTVSHASECKNVLASLGPFGAFVLALERVTPDFTQIILTEVV
jgi:hypothetical protein